MASRVPCFFVGICSLAVSDLSHRRQHKRTIKFLLSSFFFFFEDLRYLNRNSRTPMRSASASQFQSLKSVWRSSMKNKFIKTIPKTLSATMTAMAGDQEETIKDRLLKASLNVHRPPLLTYHARDSFFFFLTMTAVHRHQANNGKCLKSTIYVFLRNAMTWDIPNLGDLRTNINSLF